jgi:uncharacterized membrane protein
LKVEQVAYGGDATAPQDPTRADYSFSGWDRPFTNVTRDITVRAQYYTESITRDNDPSGGTEDSSGGVPIINIAGMQVPLAGGGSGWVWALVNLICAVLGILFGIFALIRVLSRKKDKDEGKERDEVRDRMYASESYDENPEEEKEKKQRTKRTLGLVLAIVMGLFGIIFFLLTEDMRNLMVLVDRWTIVNVFALLLGIVGFILTKKKVKKEEEASDAQAEGAPY